MLTRTLRLLIFLLPILAISTRNWYFFWVLMELTTFCIVGIFYTDKLSSKSAIKFFFVQAIRSVFIFIGGRGLLNISESLILNFVLLIGLALKLGLFPFHFWVIPLLQNVNFTQIRLLLGPIKVIPLYLIWNNSHLINPIIYLALATIFVGRLLGLNCTNIKGILAASSISHTGWVLLGNSVNIIWQYFFVYYVSLVLLLVSILMLNTFSSLETLSVWAEYHPSLYFLLR